MATEVEVKRWCDVCMARDDARVSGVHVSVSLGPPWDLTGYGLDLCEPHADEYVRPLGTALTAYGVKDDPQAPRASARPARRLTAAQAANTLPGLVGGERRGRTPEGGRAFPCLWCPLDYASANAIRNHAAKHHGVPRDTQAILGDTCPLCGQAGLVAMTAHVVRSHPDVPNAWVAMMRAHNNGDPYGVAATVLAKGTNRA